MSNRTLLICLFLALLGFTKIWSVESSNPKEPTLPDSEAYLGQTPPGDSATVFAPGIISTGSTFVQNSAFSPDGKEFYFTVTNGRWDHFEIMTTRFLSGKWTIPAKARFFEGQPKPTDGMEPFIAPDGNRIYFSAGDSGNLDIWYCQREGDVWGKPVKLPEAVNSSDLEWYPTISNKGTLFLAKNGDIYYSTSQNGKFNAMANIGKPVSSNDYDEADPYISPNEDFLIFHSIDRPGGFGQADLYISYKNQDGSWTNPKNLGPKVNTEEFEFAPSVTPDGKYLMFSRRKQWLTDTPSKVYWIKADLLAKAAAVKVSPQIKGAYFGLTPPGETPVLFAPDILTSLSAFAGAPTFSPDGTKCFVSVGAADYSTPATLYTSEWANNAWRPFVKAPFVSEFNSSCESVFLADGHTLTFTGKKTPADSTDFWTVDLTAQGWSTPVRMPSPINSGANEWRGSTMTDGTMYFGSERDEHGMYQVYKAYRDSGRKLVVEKLGPPINMNALEGDPCVAPDGHFLIFCSGRNGNSTDLFVSFKDGKGGWGTPIDLGPAFNSGNDEYGAYLTQDGKYLFFTRHTSQGDGIYWVAASAVEKRMAQNPAGKTDGNTSAGPDSPSYAIPGKPSEVVQNHEAVLALALQVEKDLKVAVQQATTQDKASLMALKSTLFAICLLKKDFAEGRRYLEAVRELQEVATAKLLTGAVTGPYLQAMEAPGADFHATYRARLTEHLAELPYKNVEGALRAMKDSVAAASKAHLVDGVVASLDPAVKDGRLGQPMAARLLNTAMNIEVILPVKDDVVASIQSVLDANSALSAIDKPASATPMEVKGPYLGQRPPGETPEPFSPDFLSARYGFVARIAFSPDGNECYFTVTDAMFSHPKILGTRRSGDLWSEPASPDFADPKWINHEPFFSQDGKKLFFTSNRDAQSETNKRDFWMVERTPKGWSEPKRLGPPINSDSIEFFYSQSADGTAYFCSNRPGGIGSMDLYRVRQAPGQPARAKNLGPRINSQYSTGDPCVAADGRFLVFSAARAEGRGGSDLYLCLSDGSGGWTAPINLGDGFNTAANEYAPSLSPDERYLFFTRHDGQRADLHWVLTSALDRFRHCATPPGK